MSDLKFKLGDVVKHKAANFNMVVLSITDKINKKYQCSWFNDNYESKFKGFQEHTFSEHELENSTK